ncbi:proline and serine-rich protein 2 isoform X2 [Denticeps clupeoides]|uniref:proline and serine-rich protein 2 isoform X2 n=1 Tax=Denticeps clupeoides TaxID=299321 RepID=UPI0010A55455|nr:proline and serine-rich protein 2 isoform X2 [Denticeps clupeoides]
MDIRLHPNLHLHYGVNGGHESPAGPRPQAFDGLDFLSLEEKECLQFFEETIDSLEDDVDSVEVPGDRRANVSQTPALTTVPRHRDSDIIDLVTPASDHSTKEAFGPIMPDFQSMKVAPESHFEIKPKRDPLENIPAEYHVPVTSGHSAPSEDSGHHHPPPGSIPTPVVIAQKIAEHQGGAGGVSLLTSMHLSHRRSIDSSTSSSPTSSPTTDHPVKQGPPTSAKPSRLPENINLLLGNREASQAVARSAANAQEIRAQRLASSSGNPMEGGEPACVRNLPTRSVSFCDPTPARSRLEALSKLGLNRGAHSYSPKSGSSPKNTLASKPVTEVYSPGGKSAIVTPLTVSSSSSSSSSSSPSLSPNPVSAVNPDHKPPSVPSTTASADAFHSDFNNYGGKTIVVNPAASSRSNPGSAHGSTQSSPTAAAPAKLEPTASELNSYGGRSKSIIPATPLPKVDPSESRDLPPPAARAEAASSELNNYWGKSKVITPGRMAEREGPAPHPEARPTPEPAISRDFRGQSMTVSPSAVNQPVAPNIVRSRTVSLPSTAPKPRMRPAPPSPDMKRKPKASFRPQGITVQFSGRGGTESRREALRKLGLLKDNSSS